MGSPSDLVTPLPPNRFYLLKLPSSRVLQARDQAFKTQENYTLHGGQEAHREEKTKVPLESKASVTLEDLSLGSAS